MPYRVLIDYGNSSFGFINDAEKAKIPVEFPTIDDAVKAAISGSLYKFFVVEIIPWKAEKHYGKD